MTGPSQRPRRGARAARALLATALVTLGLWPGSAAAEFPSVDQAPRTVSPGATTSITFNAGSATRCSLRFRGPDRFAAGPYRSRIHGGFQRIRWKVPLSVAGGAWRARVLCAQRGRRGAAALRIRVRAGNGSAPIAPRTVLWRSLEFPGTPRVNPFPRGECTFHAYELRPDIYDTAVARGVSPLGWDAYSWAPRARQAGFRVGSVPAAGALAVFKREYYGGPRPDGRGGQYGHLGYVVRVHADGSFRMSERNWGGNPAITAHTYRPAPGIVFIY